ncbi:uncharacterized protein LOC128223930 isoform X1 [Mya arenaria]|uniref:uncharacterized protein LOC128223930 isoform X1 n=1 Tax=Mya arenaria TaxID=6604 RepID=UPI0022E2089F|nr:uncharacterized protein LOC128223930 isoform X1 [Mya arenaria]XP_052789375.1 uncharacterized protein LOC128223930 isoform X1 [Mya arenaria]XP_052789376.1 uncharacterized protein LOC128223930 isoform X1 [Mya arenaria]
MMSACPKPTRMETGCGKYNCVPAIVAVSQKPKHLAVICITANIILTLAFLVLIIVWAVVRTPLTLLKESSACILCDRTKSNAYTNPDQEASGHSVIKRRDDGMCCGRVESIAQMLFQKEMAEYYYSSSSQSLIDIAEEYADCERETNDKQPIAKVVGIVEFKPSYIVEGHYRVIWNKNGRTFYSNNCVHLELEGEIFVRQPGYYIVSSQLILHRQTETSTPNNETRPTTFIHQVNLLSHMYGTTVTINGHVFAVKPARHRLPVSSTENGERSKCCISLHVQREDIEVAHVWIADFTNNPDMHFPRSDIGTAF